MAKTLTKREKWLLILGGCFAALYLFYRFVFLPQWQDYLLVQAEIKSKQESLVTLQKIYLKVQQFTQENEKKLNALNNLKSFNIGNDGTILLRLDEIAYEQGLELKIYQPQPVTLGQIPSKSIESKITGPYNGIIDFFNELDNLPYLTNIMVKQMKPVAYELEDGFKGNILQEDVMVYFSLQIFNIPQERPVTGSPKKPAAKVLKKPQPQPQPPQLPNTLVPVQETTVEQVY